MKNTNKMMAIAMTIVAIMATVLTSCTELDNTDYGKTWGVGGDSKVYINFDGAHTPTDELPTINVNTPIERYATSGVTKIGEVAEKTVTTKEPKVEFITPVGGGFIRTSVNANVMLGGGTVPPEGNIKLSVKLNTNIISTDSTADEFKQQVRNTVTLMGNGYELASAVQDVLLWSKSAVHDTIHTTHTEYVHDTTHVVVNDTVVVVNHDTTFVFDTTFLGNDTIIYRDTVTTTDTVWVRPDPVHDTTTVHDTVVIPGNPLARTLLYSDSNDTHVNTNTVGTYNQGVVTWSCGNRRDYVDHYNAAPYTGNRSVNFNITFPYTVTLAGTAYQSMVGQSVNIVNGVADFNGFTVTLVAQPRQSIPTTLGCSMDLTTATMTATGLVVNGEIEGTAVNGTIPVVINADPIINPVDPQITVVGQVVWAGVTTSHTSDNVNSGEDYLHILVNNNGTYTWYYHVYEPGLTLANFEAAILLPYEYNNIVNQLNAGRGLAKVYHHADQGATYEMGTVYGQQYSNGGWKISYYNVAGNLMNVLSMSSSTFSGYQTSNPIKAVASNGSLSYGGMSYAIRNN